MVNIPPSWLILGRAAEPPNFLQQRPRRLVLTDEGHGETNHFRICSGYIYIVHIYIYYILYNIILYTLDQICVYIYMYTYI